MAAVACGNLGQLDESERHYQEAYLGAELAKDTAAMAEIMAMLGDCQFKRGKLSEAYESSLKAAGMHEKGQRISLAIQAATLRVWGRFDEAFAIRRRSQNFRGTLFGYAEARIRAVTALDSSRMEAECDRADDAWIHIQEAHANLKDDKKLGLKCEAAAAWVLATRGQAEESQKMADDVESRLPEFERDPSTCRSVLYDLGMAAWRRGDYSTGIDCWTRYLTLKPDPVYHPTAYYHRGECFFNLGQTSEARQDYKSAVSLNIDSHDAKQARQRLEELTA
jgi:tetratricopeptide (TPR) repeat protein